MIRNIVSALLLFISVTLSFKHAWDTLHYKNNEESVKMMESLGISETFIPYLASVAIAVGVLLLIPKTFFLGNMLNAMLIAMIMGLAVRAGNYRMVLIEIPFLIMPLVMIWLKYPFKFK
ncbi:MULTISPECIES: hypothetical protein [unclassified Pedobacter]|uniref:hypothetical protein n=1 Tax=unclassified Pedobacter TaxID=2628915 RepID=UPI00142492F1|nr:MULTISPECIES: hypothetical protein [unclassified Pedobacter]NII81043.1 putative RDD family membrane protein YckC [Pedobacter sp. SG908]NMN35061.1 putative RDD family membrane protein YckC [Pedobacter sp. SG918]